MRPRFCLAYFDGTPIRQDEPASHEGSGLHAENFQSRRYAAGYQPAVGRSRRRLHGRATLL